MFTYSIEIFIKRHYESSSEISNVMGNFIYLNSSFILIQKCFIQYRKLSSVYIKNKLIEVYIYLYFFNKLSNEAGEI